MERILLSILSRPESDVFKEPVDHVGLGLFDYLDIVKQPMDLGSVKRKYESGAYENVEVKPFLNDLFALLARLFGE